VRIRKPLIEKKTLLLIAGGSAPVEHGARHGKMWRYRAVLQSTFEAQVGSLIDVVRV